jgi:hypothetical protein
MQIRKLKTVKPDFKPTGDAEIDKRLLSLEK